MPFNGTGTFVRVHNWQQDAANGIDISAPEMDAEDGGFASGLSLCVTRDGQGQMAADFLPGTASAFNCGSAAFPWLAGNFGSLNVAGAPVYAGAPINTQNVTSYTLVISDANKAVYMPNVAANALAIPSNASVPFPIGTMITIINDGASNVIAISIASDVMRLAGTALTGSRNLAAGGEATLLKVQAARWLISGIGLT